MKISRNGPAGAAGVYYRAINLENTETHEKQETLHIQTSALSATWSIVHGAFRFVRKPQRRAEVTSWAKPCSSLDVWRELRVVPLQQRGRSSVT